MKMRELEERTGVHREVIRIYLRNGLIPQPERPRRTIALYGEEHVQAIAAIKRLQRESRLTLAQIKSLMDGQGAEARIEASAFDQLEQLVAHRIGGIGPPVMVDSMLDRYPHAVEDAHVLERVGILEILRTDQGFALSMANAQMVRIWGEMRKLGFDSSLNYSAEVLGFYSEAADFIGQWEARTFLERADGRIDVEDAATMIEHAMPLMLSFFELLRRRAFFHHFERIRKKSSEE